MGGASPLHAPPRLGSLWRPCWSAGTSNGPSLRKGYYDASENGLHALRLASEPPQPRNARRTFYRTPDPVPQDPGAARSHGAAPGKTAASTRPCAGPRSLPKVELQNTVPDRIAQTPKVDNLSPDTDAAVQGNVAKVLARVQVPGQRLRSRKRFRVNVYASGVIATRPPKRIPGPATKEGRQETLTSSRCRSPPRHQTLIQVVAGTAGDQHPTGVVVNRPAEHRRRKCPGRSPCWPWASTSTMNPKDRQSGRPRSPTPRPCWS